MLRSAAVVDKTKASAALANGCLRIMSKTIRKDICNLHLPGAVAKEVHNEKIGQCLPAELHYPANIGYNILKGIQVI